MSDGAANDGNTGSTSPETQQFEPITSQDEFNRRLADRLSRERAKFADYDDLKTKAAEYDKVLEESKTEAQKQADRLADLEAKVKDYETREQIAQWKNEVSTETGIPAAALAGSTKEEIEAHAATLRPLIESAQQPSAYRPIPNEGQPAALPLNGDGIESALKSALGIT